MNPKFKIALRSGAAKGFKTFTREEQKELTESALVLIDFILQDGLLFETVIPYGKSFITKDSSNEFGLSLGLIVIPNPSKKNDATFKIVTITNTYKFERFRLVHSPSEFWFKNIKRWNQFESPRDRQLVYRKSEETALSRSYYEPILDELFEQLP